MGRSERSSAGVDLVHGRHATYVNYKCRCSLCSAALARYWERLVARKRDSKECRSCTNPLSPRSKTFCETHRVVHNDRSKQYQRRNRNGTSQGVTSRDGDI